MIGLPWQKKGLLGGIHLNKRNPEAPPLYKGSISRSCHSLEEIIEYKPVCDYVFR